MGRAIERAKFMGILQGIVHLRKEEEEHNKHEERVNEGIFCLAVVTESLCSRNGSQNRGNGSLSWCDGMGEGLIGEGRRGEAKFVGNFQGIVQPMKEDEQNKREARVDQGIFR